MQDLFELAERVKDMNLEEGGVFSAAPLGDLSGPCPDFYDPTPCPDFAERLPETLTTVSGKEYRISQSLIKALRKVAQDEMCPKRFFETRINGTAEEGQSVAMAAGHRFEFLMSGAPRRDGSEPGPMLTPKTGKPSTEETRIAGNAAAARKTMIRHGLPLSEATVGPKWAFRCLEGTLDLDYPEAGAVVDVKYSGLLDDKWNDLGWTKPGEKFSHTCQANHYLLLAELNGMERDFFFFVFDNRANKEGEYKVFRMAPSEDTRNAHKNLILWAIDQLEKRKAGEIGGFEAVPRYASCKDCPVKSCAKRLEFPEVEEVAY